MNNKDIYQLIIDQKMKDGDYISLDISLSPFEIEKFYLDYPELINQYLITPSEYFPSINVYKGEMLEIEKMIDYKHLDRVDGFDAAIKYIRDRAATKVEDIFTFLCFNLDYKKYSFDNEYEFATHMMNLVHSKPDGYLSYIVAESSLLCHELCKGGSGLYLITVQNNYFEETNTIEKLHKQVEDKLSSIAKTLFLDDMPDIVKILLAYNQIGDLANYSKDITQNLIHTPYGCLISGDCVCDGFAKAFYQLLKLGGIDSLVVNGQVITDKGEENHTWNMVKLGKDYYQIDLTWDDEVAIINHYFFMRSDGLFSLHHQWDESIYPACSIDKDFKDEIQQYLTANSDKLIAKGVQKRLISYEFINYKGEEMKPYNRYYKKK